MAWVRFELRHFDDIRVVTGGVKVLAYVPVVTSDGLRLRGDIGRWGVTSLTLPPERLVPWPEIESIQGRRGARGGGALLGLVAGVAVALVVELAHIRISLDPQTRNTGKTLFLGMAGGAALGALVDRPGHWQTVYP